MNYKNIVFKILLKYNLTTNLNRLFNLFITKISLLKQKVITKMMNHNNQILSSKTKCFYKLFIYLFLLKLNFNHNFFIPPCLFELCHIMIFNVTCMK